MAQEVSLVNSSNQEEVLSIEEAATQSNLTRQGLGQALIRFPDIKAKYTFKTLHNGRIQTVITKEGLVVLINTKNTSSRKSNTVFKIHQAKQQLAEKAVSAQNLPSDPMMAQLQMMMEMRTRQISQDARLAALESKQESPLLLETAQKVEMFLEPTANEPLTPSQRLFIKERINALVFKLYGEKIPDTAFAHARRAMNEAVGRHSIDQYNMDDYQMAIRWLKKQYVNAGLDW